MERPLEKTDWLPAMVVMGFALGLVFVSGRYGIAFYDYSFFTDTAYRLFHGQRMYVDFGGISHGPATYYLQALFFRLFGVRALSLLLHAAVVNAVSAVIVYWYFARRLPRPWACLLGLLCGIWFYGISAWPFVEYLGFFAALLSFLVWNSLGESQEGAGWKFFWIGCLTALAFWDKQNIGLVLTVVNGCLGVWFAAHWGRRQWLYGLFGGFLVVVGSFFLFLWLNGWEAGLREYFLRTEGFRRFHQVATLVNLFTYWPYLIQWFLVFLYLPGLVRGRPFLHRWRCGLLVAIVVLHYGNDPLSSAASEMENCLVALLFGVILLLESAAVERRWWRRPPVVWAAIGCFFLYGPYLAVARSAWEYAFSKQAGYAPLEYPFFRGMLVQEPERSQWKAALDFLATHLRPDEAFWIFPSGVIAYAATGRVSTAPVVSWEWYTMRMATVREGDEERMLAWFAVTPPQWVVLEQDPLADRLHHQAGVLLKALPHLAQFLESHYTPVAATPGGFEFYRRRP